MKDKLTNDFLQGLKEVEPILLTMLFKRHSFLEKGFAYFVEYRKENNTIVDFIFGPSDWDVEMIVYTSKGKFAFKDLLQIPVIAKWVNANRYKQHDVRNMENELFWFVELLKFSLPEIE